MYRIHVIVKARSDLMSAQRLRKVHSNIPMLNLQYLDILSPGQAQGVSETL